MINKSECLSSPPVCNGGTGARELPPEGRPPASGSRVLLGPSSTPLLVPLSGPHDGPEQPEIRPVWPLKKVWANPSRGQFFLTHSDLVVKKYLFEV